MHAMHTRCDFFVSQDAELGSQGCMHVSHDNEMFGVVDSCTYARAAG